MEFNDNEFVQLSLVSDSNSRELGELLTSQYSIGWNCFIRGRLSKLSKLFKPNIIKYYKTNKLGGKYEVTAWMKNIIQGVWNIYHDVWSFFCRSTFDFGNETIGKPTIKSLY